MVKANAVQAVTMALRGELKRDKNVVVIGEDVGLNGGVFRATDGLQKEFGKDRVIDTPLSELGIAGAAVGMAVNGMKPVAEIQFSGFLYASFDQLVSHAGRIRSRSRGRFSCPMVIRAPAGGGIRALELHCECNEALFAHTPGLKVVYPSTPYDVKGLLAAAIQDPDPVVFLEPMRIYRAIKEEVPEEDYVIPLGKANVVREGTDMTLITWGALVKSALQAVESIKDKVNVEVIDLRTIYPFDVETVIASVKKTGRALVLHEAPRTGGFGAEIVAQINEKALDSIEAPVLRITGYDMVLPFANLENEYIPSEERIIAGIHKVMDY
jgi:pyruvate dehydrogenase E1 component beta subunit